MTRNFLSAGLLALAALASRPALASQVVVHSSAPYWQVGDRDPKLSGLCSSGRFNQVQNGLYIAEFVGGTGSGVLGIAKGKNSLNLRDPGHVALPSEDYFFLGDGTSDCSVFVGGRRTKPPPPPATPLGGKTVPGPVAPSVAAPAQPTKP
jgi:hypothetical protein